MKKLFLILIAIITLGLSSCGIIDDKIENPDIINAAFLCSDECMSNGSNAYNQLQSSMLATLETEMISPSMDVDFSEYDLIYIDKSVIDDENFNAHKIETYVYDGGSVFLDNELYNSFSLDFLGAQSVEKIETCPVELTYPEDADNDIKKIQELIYDFISLYKDYKNYDTLAAMDYGWGIIPSTAQVIAGQGEKGLYTLNQYGNGYVFLTNPLLPNIFSVNNLSPDDTGEYMSASTIGANILMRSYFAEFLSLKKYHYAIERVFGSFGTRNISWELHYEDITGIKNKSAISFDELCRKYHQFPSYTLIRSPFVWFERAESVTYIIQDEHGYSMDSYENMYASGNHFVTMNNWLTIDKYTNTESFFNDLPEYIKRAAPYPTDLDNDGKMDLLCGSADGYIYFYSGIGMKTNYEVGAATYITDTSGNPLNVGAYSSPVIKDVNNDGILELFTGSEDGSVYCYRQETGLAFSYLGEIQTYMTDCMIDLGDLNNDGAIDMAVGSRNGEMKIYFGSPGDIYINGIISFAPPISVDSQQSWCSPCIADIDNDGTNELYAGVFEGYIAKYTPDGNGGYYFDGYIDGNEWNYKHNNHLKFGNNCVPRFYDINNDGMMDLICGQLEYGMAVPIDSEYFPCADELKEQIEYCKENNIYIGAHMMTHEYADTNHEQYELSMQKAAFESYGLDWEGIGVNQHTWYTSKVGYDANFDNMSGYNGTYLNELNSGLYWNSGSQTPNSLAVPQVSAENSINIPFYLISSVKNGLLMLQPSNIPYGNSAYAYLSAKYEVPVLLYDHCDHIYSDQSEQEEQLQKVNKFVEAYNYSFVGEDQMAKAVAAAYNTHVDAKWESGELKIQAKEASFIKPLLYNKNYQSSVGVKIIFSDSTYVDNFKADANVWYKQNDAFYVSLDRPATLTIGDMPYSIHITSVNIPAKIQKNSNKAKIEFLEGGMMQVKVEGVATTSCDGWETEKDGDITVFTKYGKAETLEITQ
jgi:hypothetical protein